MLTATSIPESVPAEVLAEMERAGRTAARLDARGLLPHFELDADTGALTITLPGPDGESTPLSPSAALGLSAPAAPARS